MIHSAEQWERRRFRAWLALIISSAVLAGVGIVAGWYLLAAIGIVLWASFTSIAIYERGYNERKPHHHD